MELQAIDYNPFSANKLQKVIPATEQQLEIWSSVLFGGAEASLAFNESVTLLLDGALNEEALKRAFAQVVKRHESLRCAFSPDGAQLCVFANVAIDFLGQDISCFDLIQQEDTVKNYIKHDVSKPFDLVNGPLFRIALFRRSLTRHQVIFTIHHIVCDGWSLGLIIKELGELYKAAVNKQSAALPEPTAFSEYAIQQISITECYDYTLAEDYWLKLYKNFPTTLDVPTDHPRPPVRTFSSRRDDFVVDKEVVDGLRLLSKTHKCSFITLFIAAFEVFLYRLTGQIDITIGLPAAGQPAIGQPNLVGHCVNLLPLKSVICEDLNFTSYLQQRTAEILDAFDHQQMTLGSLIKKLNIKRDPSRVPLVPFAINVDLGFDEGINFGDLQHRISTNPRVAENFEIFVNLSDAPDGLQLEWSYNTQLFKPETIQKMMLDFQALVQQVSADPSTVLKQIGVSKFDLNREEVAGNNVSTPYPAQPVHELIDKVAGQFGNKIAVTDHTSSITYQTLVKRANQLACILQNEGVSHGDRVAVLLDRSVNMVVALLAVLKAGAAYVPLDIIYPVERLNYMLEDSGAQLLLTQANYTETLTYKIPRLHVESIDWTIDTSVSPTQVNYRSLAYLIYTSGSTGKPKGVEVEHRSLVNFLCSMQQAPGVKATDKLLAVTTISFDIAALEIFLPLITGAEVVLAAAGSARDGKTLLTLIDQHQITLMQATPATWTMMLAAGWNTSRPLKALCGGEALSKTLATALQNKCQELWNMYGPTETTVWSAVKQIKGDDAAITIGRAINNTQVYILDDNSKPVAHGQTGEICIGGDGVARGYHNRPDLTAEKFVINKTLSESRIYRTGDLGKYNDDGELICLGRTDFQIKLRGYRIEVEEIESQLLQLPFITGAVVIAVDDRLLAYVTADGYVGNNDELAVCCKNHLKKSLPAYMVPSTIQAVSAFPLTPNGKTDRSMLIRQAQSCNEVQNNDAVPETPTEKMLVTLWKKLLHLNAISLTADFFEMGGHSLLAAQMIAEIEKSLGAHVPLAMLFKYPTIATLASYLDKGIQQAAPGSLMAIKTSGSKPPLFIVHGYGLHVHMFNFLAQAVDAEQPVYALQAKGLNGIDEPADDLVKLAKYYVSEIIKVHPSGPLALGGYSLGGSIALEMAKQLNAAGRRITVLAMIDSYAEVSFIEETKYKAVANKAVRQFGKLKFVAQSLLQNPASTIRYQSTIIKSHFRRWLGSGEPEHEVHSPLIDEIYTKLNKALEQYKLTPYGGKVAVFKAKTRAYYVPDSKYLGWKTFAKQGIDIYEIPGDHQTMLTGTNSVILAKKLQEALDSFIN
jgi:amino acid adenylation domain-containing protein